ncbi:alkaline phosphatase family protein [Cyclobacterium amurskyense]|uniref:Type I phosphodiesterase/nucleotide pyrophosphatase n=1 Tax=Cyclobacterium amurskyense TaxID=320787 RepID=A0A0H4PG87_9BACT|nr:alkaline phosphatase family protein [Cyclobacterium amurskyense]AKP53239.1 Type I phosphodiesterase/nucleotide pyrophosphatase [Cyclobacterium amurskyense]
MKKNTMRVAIIFMFSTMLTLAANAQEKKTLFIILDGIQRELLERNPTPNLDEIASLGQYTHAYVGGKKGGYSETPTISAVGYNSLLTGVWVNKHNVKGNSIREPNYNYPTIFRKFKENYPNKTIAVYSTWLDNRTKLVGENLKETGHLQLDYHFDGLETDTLSYPHDNKSDYIKKIDQAVSTYAANDVLTKGPDMTWVYLQYTDDMGHRFGESPQMNAGIQEADRQVGLIWEAIQKREKAHNEEWMIIITTDHGRKVGGRGHGGQSDEERATWIVSNKKFNGISKNTPGVVDIFPTIVDYMDIAVPKNQAMELDGVSLLGEAYASHLSGSLKGESLSLSWKDYGIKGKALVWVSPTNQYKYGETDIYRQIGAISLEEGSDIFDLKFNYDQLKVVVELPNGYLNVWVTNEE